MIQSHGLTAVQLAEVNRSRSRALYHTGPMHGATPTDDACYHTLPADFLSDGILYNTVLAGHHESTLGVKKSCGIACRLHH